MSRRPTLSAQQLIVACRAQGEHGAMVGVTLFDTALGRCGIAWDAARILAVRLPEGDDEATRLRLVRRFDAVEGAALPPFVRDAIAAITRHLSGGTAQYAGLPLAFDDLPPFDRSVLELTRDIPCGATRTYGEIARTLGQPLAARAVGAALGRNPWPIVVPCHRVLAAGGKLGGFSAPGGRNAKRLLLAIEQARPPGAAPDLFDAATASD